MGDCIRRLHVGWLMKEDQGTAVPATSTHSIPEPQGISPSTSDHPSFKIGTLLGSIQLSELLPKGTMGRAAEYRAWFDGTF